MQSLGWENGSVDTGQATVGVEFQCEAVRVGV